MRRLLGILFAILLPTLVIGAIALSTYRTGLPEMAQATLDHYVSYQRYAGHPVTVAGVTPASHPTHFTASLSGLTFGDGIYYQVSAALEATAPAPPTATPSTEWANLTAITSAVGPIPMTNPQGQRQMPYPPEQIWCIRLQPDGGGPPSLVLLALHQDLYNASWAVHELPPATAAQTLAEVGCAAQ